MKRIIIIIGTMIAMLFASSKAQTINQFFDKYHDDTRFESVTVGKFMLGLAKFSSEVDDEEREILDNVNKVRVLTSKDKVNPEFAQEVLADFQAMVEDENLEPLVEVKEKGEIVKIYARAKGEAYTDLLISVKEDDELNLVWISGKLSQQFLGKIKTGEAGQLAFTR